MLTRGSFIAGCNSRFGAIPAVHFAVKPWAILPQGQPNPATSPPMNILLLGSGGREHALAWKIAGSPLTTKLWCAPGNAGIAREAECAPIDITEHSRAGASCRANMVGFVVVGPEAPLVAGIVDYLVAAGFKTFGPRKAAARLEGSKAFPKDLCKAHN